MVIHKSFSDFVLFLYLHMAHADGSFHDSEQHVILNKIPKLFPGELDALGKMRRANEEYESISQEMVIPIIRETFKHFKNIKFSQKYKVYTDMYDIIQADGQVDESETKALDDLKEIVGLGSISN